MTARTYLRRLSDEIVLAQRPIRILKALNWDSQVHTRFFKHHAKALPDPVYPALDYVPEDKIREFQELRRRIRGRNAVEAMLRAKCDEFIEIVRMLAARGTKRFFHHSVNIYGEPRRAFRDSGVDNLRIAHLWAGRPIRLSKEPEARELGAEEAAEVIRQLIAPTLGDACRVKVSKRLTADAAAGGTGVSVRQDARFTLRQARALAHHEGLWHVLTSLNGYAQPVLTVLGVGLAGFATSQEGGGVVAEYLSGNITADRYRELGQRAIVVDLAAQGADYLEVYRHLIHRFAPEKAAQMCERVFRGGVLTGGAPFTKDAIYQRGYCRVFNFIRHAIEHGELDLLLAFFTGKMSLDDAPLVAALIEDGIVTPPRFLPGWAHDLEGLGAEVLHSLTISRFDLGKVSRYYEKLSAHHELGLENYEAEIAGHDVEQLAAVAEHDLAGDPPADPGAPHAHPAASDPSRKSTRPRRR